jgi:hypothetical protein
VTPAHKPRKRLPKEAIPPLIISTLGTVGAAALYYLIPGFQFMELALMLVVVGLSAVGYAQGLLHGVMTAVMLYVATGVAATFYRAASPYVHTILQALALLQQAAMSMVNPHQSTTPGIARMLGEGISHDTLAVSFCLLTIITWGALEAINRASFKDTSLPRLGILDNLGGVLVHLAIGILVASLLFNAIGYGQQRRVHNNALLRPTLNKVLYLYYTAQSFWFPKRPPPIYVYDLDLPH